MDECSLLLIKQVFVAVINSVAMSSSSFIKNCAGARSGFPRPVPKGCLLATFLVGWPQLLPECLCQHQRQMDFSLAGWAQGCAEARFVTLRLAGAEPAEMYKHIILFDQRGSLFLASRLNLL